MLPLSWIHNEEDLELNMVPLLRAQFFNLGTANAAISYDSLFRALYDSSAGAFLLRGVRKSLMNKLVGIGCEAARLGCVADIDPKQFSPKKSLIELGERGAVHGYFRELDAEQGACQRRRTLAMSKYRGSTLSLLFRQQILTGMRTFLLQDRGSTVPLTFASISRSGNCSWQLEEFVRSHSAPVGSMEALLLSIIQLLRAEGVSHFSLGEVPFVDQKGVGLSGAESSTSLVESAVNSFGRACQFAYQSNSLFQFKDKFQPKWSPVYWTGFPRLYLRDFIMLAHKVNYTGLLYSSSCQSFRRFMPSLPTL